MSDTTEPTEKPHIVLDVDIYLAKSCRLLQEIVDRGEGLSPDDVQMIAIGAELSKALSLNRIATQLVEIDATLVEMAQTLDLGL